MKRAATSFDRYLNAQLKDAAFASAYAKERTEIATIDEFVRQVDALRLAAGKSKADLARATSVPQASLRRLFSSEHANPTLETVFKLLAEFNCVLQVVPMGAARTKHRATPKARRSAVRGQGTRRQAA